jgi:mevalonate kinase
MKTIAQIAKEIGVSKQAIFYRIKKTPLSNDLIPLMSKIDGVLMVSFYGEILIKQAFNGETVKMFDDKELPKTNTNFDGEIIKLLQENILVLQEQLKIKDHQIDQLTETVKTQAESIKAAYHNELAETLIDNQQLLEAKNIIQDEALPSEQKEKKEPLIKRLFKKKN